MGKGSNAIQNNQVAPTVDMAKWVCIYARLLIAELPVKVRKMRNGYYKLNFYNTRNRICASYILGPNK